MHRSLPVFLVLGLLAFPGLASYGGEEEAAPAAAPSLDQAERVAQRYLSLEVAGNHAGGVGMRVGVMADGGLIFETRMRMEISRSTVGDTPDKFVVEQTGSEFYDAEGNLVVSEEAVTEAGVVTKVRAVYEGDHVSLTTDGPGGVYDKRLALPEDHGTDIKVFQKLRAAYEDGETGSHEYQSLDARSQAFKPNTMWLIGKATYEHGGKTFDGWKVRQKAEDMIIDFVVGDDFLPFEMSLMGGIMKAKWVDEAPFEVEGGGWAVSAMVDVDRVVKRAFDLEMLEVRFLSDPPPAEDAPPIFEHSPYQTVTREPAGYRMVLYGQRLPKHFAPPALPVVVEDPAVVAFLEATPFAQSDHADIQSMAAKITKDAPDALKAAAKIVHWVWANVAKRAGARGGATAVEVLQNLEGDCTEHAVLTVALSRAAGIPARAVSGVVYVVVENRKAFAGYHAWAEVWLGRWVPVDATIPEVGTTARYVRMGVDEPGQPDRSGRLLPTLNAKTRLEIVAWKHYGGERVEAEAAD